MDNPEATKAENIEAEILFLGGLASLVMVLFTGFMLTKAKISVKF